MPDTAFLGADHILKLVEVTDVDSSAQTNATVQIASIVDVASDATVTGQSYPISGSHSTGGDYEIALSKDLAFTVGRQYQARGSITLASGKVRPFRHNFVVDYFETPGD